MTMKPLCVVLMPLGSKTDPESGLTINFDRIYETAIRPGIEAAGMEPIGAVDDRAGGILKKSMFERLILCDYAVADLTTANANVFYQLGVRHSIRPNSTLCIFGGSGRIPFDVTQLRGLHYRLGEGHQFESAEAADLKVNLSLRLRNLRHLNDSTPMVDSPVFYLLGNYESPNIPQFDRDLFQTKISYIASIKSEIAKARSNYQYQQDGLKEIQIKLGNLEDVDTEILIDLIYAYRSLDAWDMMVELFQAVPTKIQKTYFFQAQYGLALSRLKRREKALIILNNLLEKHKNSSEIYGLIGRIYKDLWFEAKENGKTLTAKEYLKQAINMYTRGFEVDLHDQYYGITAITLLDILGDQSSLEIKKKLAPLVRYAVEKRLSTVDNDYWDYAMLLELAVLENKPEDAENALHQCLSLVTETFQIKTTVSNLRLIENSRKERGVTDQWLFDLIHTLEVNNIHV